jgi:hypothetical protein
LDAFCDFLADVASQNVCAIFLLCNNKFLFILKPQLINQIRFRLQTLYDRIYSNSEAFRRFSGNKRIQKHRHWLQRQVIDKEVVENVIQFGLHDLLVKLRCALRMDPGRKVLEHLLDAQFFESHSKS